MSRESAAARVRPPPDPAPASPIERYLETLRARLADDRRGAVATYIPELGRADPEAFGLCVATADGRVHAVGDVDAPFTIQSMSKPFAYGRALDRLGRDAMLARVGVEPTGESFNAIVLDEANNRPFNPMVNAGAIAVAACYEGASPAAREAAMRDLFSRLAGRPLEIDESVYESERATGHRNRAIAYMMLNSGMLEGEPESLLDLYFRQCSVLVTARDMALMAATLANHGVQPVTGERVFGPDSVRDVLTVMATCGMYDYAGQWAYDVGLPAKSGVSGGIIAVAPGQAGVAIWAPRLDPVGNSVRGVEACKALSRDFALHIFGDRNDDRAVIRREYTAATVRSKRVRTAAQQAALRAEGGRIAVIEAQGALYFGAAEVLAERLLARAAEAETVILCLRRGASADAGAAALLVRAARAVPETGARLAVAGLWPDGPLAPLRRALEAEAETTGVTFHDTADLALEDAENALLATQPALSPDAKFAFSKIELFAGMAPEDHRLLEAAVAVFHFDEGQALMREGDEANAFFVVARGAVSVFASGARGRRRRIATIGPGEPVGEMALVDGGRRSADVIADAPTICYAFSIERLQALAADRPSLLITILGNLVGALSGRLRIANAEIRSLD